MTTFVGIFFSVISILGLVKGQAKRSLRKIVLVAFSIFLVLVQILFISRVLRLDGQEFIGLSGILSGIILILAFQKDEPW